MLELSDALIDEVLVADVILLGVPHAQLLRAGDIQGMD
jgi:hypothetical protein